METHHDDDTARLHDGSCVLPEPDREQGRIQAAGTEDVVHDEVVLLGVGCGALFPSLLGALGPLSDKRHAVLDSDAPDT